MAEERPEEMPEWATNNESLIKAPTVDKRKLGYSIDKTTGLADIPSLKGENWFRNLVYKWIKYFDYRLNNQSTNVPYKVISEQAKKLELNKWYDLKEFTLEKGTWLLSTAFNHTIAERRAKLDNPDRPPLFVCGVSEKSGDLITELSPNKILSEVLKLSEINNSLYYSDLAKDYESETLGSAVENVGFTCVLTPQKLTKYYVKSICFTYPNKTEIYTNYYRITAIKLS